MHNSSTYFLFFNVIVRILSLKNLLFLIAFSICNLLSTLNALTSQKLECNICDFKCNKNSDYLRHLSTSKHKIRINPNSLYAKNAETI